MNFNTQGTSRPPCGRSTDARLLPVTSHAIVPLRLRIRASGRDLPWQVTNNNISVSLYSDCIYVVRVAFLVLTGQLFSQVWCPELLGYVMPLYTAVDYELHLRRVKDRHTKWRDDLCIRCKALSFPLYNLAEAFAVFFEWNSGQDVKRNPKLRARRNSRSEKCTRTEAIFNTKTENTAIKSWTNGNKFCTLRVTTLCSQM